MKRMMLLLSLIVVLGAFAACEKEDPFNWDVNLDLTQEDTSTTDPLSDTPPEVTPDTAPDVTPDITPDTLVDTPPDTPIEIIPDGTGDSYGIINANFSTTYILDGSRLSDTTYLSEHGDAISMVAAFTGTYGTGRTIPGTGAAMTQSLAGHFPAGSTYPAFVGVVQQSADATGANPVNPWVELDFADDNVAPGNYALDITSTAPAVMIVLNYLGPSNYCVLALALGGSINVSASSNTTATEGGSITLSGSNIPVYHPTNVPGYGDISAELGVAVCPIE